MKILVTGGAGFIGSHVCDRLLSEGYEVICIDNLNDYYNPKIKERNIRHNLDNSNFHFFKIDIRNNEELKKLFSNFKIDKIIHLAAMAGVRNSIKNPQIYFETNVLGSVNLLELAKEHDIKRFIFASSSSVYGNSTEIPFNEDNKNLVPISPYAASKMAGEICCRNYHHMYKLNITVLRFFTVYGPRGRPDMAPFSFVKDISEGNKIKKYGDGSTKRDYTYITDIVNGILAALKNDYISFDIINLGNSNPISLNEFISTIENVVGKKAIIEQHPIPLGDVNLTYADVTKANKLLGYNPQTKLEQGMIIFYDWYSKCKNENII